MLKKCKRCSLELPVSRFYWLGYVKIKDGSKAYSSYCRACSNNVRNVRKTNRPYNKRIKKDFKEKINIEVRYIYLLLKKIEINHLKLDSIDALRLVNEYIKVYGDDISEIYCEEEQLDIMYFKLSEYIKNN